MRFVVVLSILWLPLSLFGQKKFWLYKYYENTDTLNKEYAVFSDSSAMIKSLEKETEKWWAEGYILAGIDSIRCQKDTCLAAMYKGQKYAFGKLKFDSTTQILLQGITIRTKKFENGMNLRQWPVAAGEINRYFMNRGYPFCKVQLKNIDIQNSDILASLFLEKGPLVLYDSLNIKGNINLNKNFTRRYFQIYPELPYDQSQILQIQNKSKKLLFAKVTKDAEVRFVNQKAVVDIFLDKAPISRFDFILGILPNNSVNTEGKKWTISGDVKGEFYNRFGLGEYIFGQYKKLKPENQEMILKFSMPYIYNFAFGIDSDFRLFRNGTQHIDLTASGGLQYMFSGVNQLKMGYQYKSSRLIEINRQSIQSSGKLPQNLDVIYRSGVMRIVLMQTDYFFNPSRGMSLDGRINIGQKKILPNDQITTIPGFENIYETVSEPTLQMESEVDLQWFFPVKKLGAIRLRTLSGIKINSKGVQLNEFYRIGGNATLRGFDEEGIWTDRYITFSTEFRLFLDRNSFLTLPFFDFSLQRILVDERRITDDAMGLGIALNFSTNVGMFNVSFAAGRRLDQPFDFGNMKVHFGYLNLF